MKYDINHAQALSILELKTGASDKQLKKAFRKKAFQYHPDKGGTAGQFKLIKQAHYLLLEQGTTEKAEPVEEFGHLVGFGNPWAGVSVKIWWDRVAI